jgi:deazaflavin-dependent oxidoreductase (nitroreductase family)
MTMRKTRVILGAVAASAAVAWWTGHRRFGSRWINRVADPWLVSHGMIERSGGEIGLIEHVGRRTGIVRVSPVHPVRSENGFRIVVPLGLESEWAQNVLAAGHCRLRIGDEVHELDEPLLVSPLAVAGRSAVIAHLTDLLGFRYLLLHRFDVSPAAVMAETEPAASLTIDEELVPA